MPDFTVEAYAELLTDIAGAGYQLLPVEELAHWDGAPTVYLRHDIDIHLAGVQQIAQREQQLGARATYFVPVALPFNPAYPPNREVLDGLLTAGHRLGLHYDLSCYPAEQVAADAQLEREVSYLEALTGAPIRSICMHNPGLGGVDLFAGTRDYIHPHAFPGVVYVSDSCRAWRDESLLSLFRPDPPPRLLLNTHPELWLGPAGQSRAGFLRDTLRHNALAQHESYLTDQIAAVWAEHPGPALHDRREAGR